MFLSILQGIGIRSCAQGAVVALAVVAEDGGVDGIEEPAVVASVNPHVSQELVL